MISFLRGIIESKEPDSIIVNVNDIGYQVYVPVIDKFVLSSEKQSVFTYLYIREDKMVLYGFPIKKERDFFKILIETPGIGPKVAFNIIIDMIPEEFKKAVLEENLSLISSVPGIGNRLAKKIVLELKEKFKKLKTNLDYIPEGNDTDKGFIKDSIEVLKTLGYSEKEAKQRIISTLKDLKNQKSIVLEDLIKIALNKKIL